uniref:Afadin-and alpha-actinin-binding protein n=1 Tax=Mesocestoides corti TaxID=53468 RepID=A0A5K3FJ56_MESCO
MTSDVQAGGDGRPLEFDVVPVDPNFELPAKLFVDWNVGLYSKLQTLNAEFVGMGHAPCLFKKDSSYVTVHFNAFVTACYALFERYLQNINARETVDENIMRLSIDLEHSRKMHSRCKAELELSQTAVHQGKERERKLEAEKSTLCAQLRASNESIRRMRSDMQHRTTQFQHEVKKREQESLGLKNRLNLLLRGQSQSRCVRSSSAVAGSRKIERLTSSASATTDSTEEHGTLRSQLDLARSMLAHLTSRENDLFYENRELRDLISVLSSRMVRFSRHLKLRRLWRRDVVAVVDADDDDDANDEVEEEEETSLDGVSGDEAVDATNDFSASFSSSSTSSSDEDDVAASGSRRDRRRQSANVHALLLEMPFHMVRDHLTRRVHRLSRRLWREVKAVGASTSPPRVGDDATSEGKSSAAGFTDPSEFTFKL